MGVREAGGALGRRGLLAGAAALVAGGLAKLSGAERAEATHGGTPPAGAGPGLDTIALHVGLTTNTSDIPTGLSGTIASEPVLTVRNNTSTGVLGGDGLQAAANASSAAGVRGLNAGSGPGVWGRSLFGAGSGAIGESGAPASATSRAGIGVAGFGSSGGVRGDSGDGNGIFGVSTNASGAYGFSNHSYGVIGNSNVGVGVQALSSTNWGLHAQSSNSFAGVFSGPVYINGSMSATGAKSAVVKNKRGEHRRLYCQESPEPWFEDFGTAELKGGHVAIDLDPEFDAVVKGDAYHVYLTPEGDCRGLYVSRKAPHRFEVRELQGGTSSLPFGYRVVARRLDDVGRRLEKVDVPDFSKLKPLPTPPDVPTKPEEPGRPGR